MPSAVGRQPISRLALASVSALTAAAILIPGFIVAKMHAGNADASSNAAGTAGQAATKPLLPAHPLSRLGEGGQASPARRAHRCSLVQVHRCGPCRRDKLQLLPSCRRPLLLYPRGKQSPRSPPDKPGCLTPFGINTRLVRAAPTELDRIGDSSVPDQGKEN